MTQLSGKRVLITGAASGLGRLMAHECGKKGATVALWDINQAGLDQVVSELEEKSVTAHAQVVNLCAREEISAAAEKVISEVGGIDILINNAGLVTGKPLLESEPLAIEQTFAVNTMALFWAAQAFLPGMIERGDGHVVTIASMAGLVGIPNAVDYCASKHAAVGFDESLRLEMKKQGHNVRTTVVCPYAIDTGMFDGFETRFSWIFPILKPEDVVAKTLSAVEKNRARLFMPWAAWSLYINRYLPMGIFDRLMDALGATSALDHFKGRPGAHAGEIGAPATDKSKKAA